jgi:hypothetical protein
VEFSSSDVEADDLVIAAVDGLHHSHPALVATNDKRVRSEAYRRGANVISVDQLLAAVRRLPARRR